MELLRVLEAVRVDDIPATDSNRITCCVLLATATNIQQHATSHHGTKNQQHRHSRVTAALALAPEPSSTFVPVHPVDSVQAPDARQEMDVADPVKPGWHVAVRVASSEVAPGAKV
jgi:hypothetical protein